jgi:hypothetical protein
MGKELEPKVEFRDEKKENLSRRISFWFSLVVSIALTCWYYSSNPPDTTEMMKMRSFFKENIMDVAKFIRLPYDEMEQFAESKTHPFYKTYFKASGVEKDKVKALIHISRDYNPNQYWFNMMFLWVIAFTSLWFLGLMLEAVMILVRRDDAERKWRRKQNVE